MESKGWAQRQAHGLQEIKKGLADGRLTQAEASKLLAQHARAASIMDSVFEDGEITVEERGRLWAQVSQAEWSLYIAQSNQDRGKPVLDASALAMQGEQINQIAQGLVSGELSGCTAAPRSLSPLSPPAPLTIEHAPPARVLDQGTSSAR